MGLNIKNPEVERLAKEFAEKTGKGQTEAIGVALREALARLDETARQREIYDAIMAISAETAPLLKDFDWDEALYGENGLYDRETGLPK
jgi:antitoxin VapB